MKDVPGFDNVVPFNFRCNQKNQKYLIEILLIYSRLDLKTLSVSLDVAPHTILEVMAGVCFLDLASGRSLTELFLVYFGG